MSCVSGVWSSASSERAGRQANRGVGWTGDLGPCRSEREAGSRPPGWSPSSEAWCLGNLRQSLYLSFSNV